MGLSESCGTAACCCGPDAAPSCCSASLMLSADCCSCESPNVRACMDSICPARQACPAVRPSVCLSVCLLLYTPHTPHQRTHTQHTYMPYIHIYIYIYIYNKCCKNHLLYITLILYHVRCADGFRAARRSWQNHNIEFW